MNAALWGLILKVYFNGSFHGLLYLHNIFENTRIKETCHLIVFHVKRKLLILCLNQGILDLIYSSLLHLKYTKPKFRLKNTLITKYLSDTNVGNISNVGQRTLYPCGPHQCKP